MSELNKDSRAKIEKVGFDKKKNYFSCADGDDDVLFLFNEKPLQIHGCHSNGICKLSTILDRFSRFIDVNCMDVFCRNS